MSDLSEFIHEKYDNVNKKRSCIAKMSDLSDFIIEYEIAMKRKNN